MRKKIKKAIISTLVIATLLSPITAFAIDNEVSNDNVSIVARGDTYIWVFETRNGKLYKRLFNTKTGKYVGDWILVG